MTCGSSRIYVGDIGTEFQVDTCTTLTGATTLELLVRKPDGTFATWTGAILDLTKIKYTTVANDLNQVGFYSLHAHVVLSSGTWTGNLCSFQVWERWVA